MKAIQFILGALVVLVLALSQFACDTGAPASINGLPDEGPALLKRGNGASGGTIGNQQGTESKFCRTSTDTWVGSDSTTYGTKVLVWHDALPTDTTVTVNFLNSTAVEFLPS